jgi:hypothetical protein
MYIFIHIHNFVLESMRKRFFCGEREFCWKLFTPLLEAFHPTAGSVSPLCWKLPSNTSWNFQEVPPPGSRFQSASTVYFQQI